METPIPTSIAPSVGNQTPTIISCQRDQLTKTCHPTAEVGADRTSIVQVAPIASNAEMTLPTTQTTSSTGSGRYMLHERLGEGGMGWVYKAEQIHPVHRFVALKVLRPGENSGEILARFEAEKQVLALMDHPHIARVLDAGTGEDGVPFFVMELVQGVPLITYCDQKRLSLCARLELFQTICQAIQYAHQKGILHRDLKPSNILVEEIEGKPQPKIIDFGLAKLFGTQQAIQLDLTVQGQVLGTPRYMAPEQTGPNNVDVDTRTDVYSLGVILYELLTRTTPIEQERIWNTDWQTMFRLILEEEPTRPSQRVLNSKTPAAFLDSHQVSVNQLSRELQDDLDWIVLKALEKNREKRYESASALALDVQRYLRVEPVLAGPPSLDYRLRKFMRRNQGIFITVTLLLIALLVGTGVSIWQAVRATEAEALAELRLRQANQSREDERRQRELAETHLAEAQAIELFLTQDLLRQASPEFNDRSKKITVEELLNRSAERLESRFADRPLVEASLRDTIGSTYNTLGDYEKAKFHLDRSIELRKYHLGADDPKTLQSLEELAIIEFRLGHTTEAEHLWNAILQARTCQAEEKSLDCLRVHHHLGSIYLAQAKFEQAKQQIEWGIQGRTEYLGSEHQDTLESQQTLAAILIAEGAYPKAKELLQQLVPIQTRVVGANHPQTIQTLSQYAATLRALGAFQEAATVHRQLWEQSCKQCGSEHPVTLERLHKFAIALQDLGQLSQATQYLEQILEQRKKNNSENHPDTGRILNNLAALYKLQGDHAKSFHYMQRAVQCLEQALGRDHVDTLSCMNNLVLAHSFLGKFDQAEKLQQEVLQRMAGKLPETHPLHCHSLMSLAEIYKVKEQYPEAERVLVRVHQIRSQTLGSNHKDTLMSLASLATISFGQENWTVARDHFVETVDLCRKHLGPTDNLTLACQSYLGQCYFQLRDYQQAQSLQEELVAIAKKKFGETNPFTLNHVNHLALTYRALHRLEEAETMVQHVWQNRKAKLGDKHVDTMIALGNWGLVLKDQNRTAEALCYMQSALDGLQQQPKRQSRILREFQQEWNGLRQQQNTGK